MSATSGISAPALHASGGGLQKYEMSNTIITVADEEKHQSKKAVMLPEDNLV
jgi:hypothetical protein